MKKNFKKKTILAILMIVIITIFSVNVFGAITPTDPDTEATSQIGSAIVSVTKYVMGVGGMLLKPLLGLGAALAGIITACIGTICSLLIGQIGGEEEMLFIPFSDLIIFNRLAAFDPNFINPAKASGDEWSLIELMSKIVSPLYFTGQTVVGGIFVILALIIGIKLAISATAQEKAQFKTAISKWVLGLFFLFVGHFYMSTIFTINEKIVATLSEASDKNIVPVGLVRRDSLEDHLLFLGQQLVDIWNWLEKIIPGDQSTDYNQLNYKVVYGYSGLFAYHMQNAALYQDFTSLMIWYILLGQTVSVMMLYFKRVFYSIFLGLIYPFTVAMDTFNKIMGKNKGLLENWTKHFTINVFTQTFHAFIMFFSLVIIAQVIDTVGITPPAGNEVEGEVSGSGKLILVHFEGKSGRAAGMASLIQVVAMTSIVSLERLIKEFTGVETGKSGDAKNSALQMLAGVRLAGNGVKNLADNITGTRSAAKARTKARMSKFQAENQLRGLDKNSTQNVPRGLIRGIGYRKVRKGLEREAKKEQAFANEFGTSASFGNNSGKMGSKQNSYVGSNSNQNNESMASSQTQSKNSNIKMQQPNIQAQQMQATGNVIINDSANKNMNGGLNSNSSKNNQVEFNKGIQSINNAIKEASQVSPKLNNINSDINSVKSSAKLDSNNASNVNKNLNATVNPSLSANTNTNKNENSSEKKFNELKQKYVQSAEEEKKANAEYKKKLVATLMTPGITTASIGIGMGAANSIDDVMKVGGVIATSLDRSIEKSTEKAYGKISELNINRKINKNISETQTQSINTVTETKIRNTTNTRQASQTTQPVQTTQTRQYSQPVQTTQTRQSSQTTQPVQTTQTRQYTQPVQTTQTRQSSQPPQPVQTTQTRQYTQPPRSTQTRQSSKPTQPHVNNNLNSGIRGTRKPK